MGCLHPQDVPAVDGTSRVRVFMRLAYDGSGFHGFAFQPGCRTVAGALMDAIKAIAYDCDGIVCAGRTDAGVHARDQVIHVDINVGGQLVSPGNMARSLNKMLSPEVVILQAGIAPAGFDARHSATARSYMYTIMNTLHPDPLMARQVWHVRAPLDVRSMRTAADCMLGVHDFSAFCRRKKGDKSGTPITREILSTRLEVRKWDERWRDGDGVRDGRGRGDALEDYNRERDGRWRDGDGVWIGNEAGSGDIIERDNAAGRGESINSGRVVVFEVAARSFCHQMVRSLVGMLVEVGRGRSTPADVYSLLQGHSRVSFVAPPEGLCLTRVDYGGIELLGEGDVNLFSVGGRRG